MDGLLLRDDQNEESVYFLMHLNAETYGMFSRWRERWTRLHEQDTNEELVAFSILVSDDLGFLVDEIEPFHESRDEETQAMLDDLLYGDLPAPVSWLGEDLTKLIRPYPSRAALTVEVRERGLTIKAARKYAAPDEFWVHWRDIPELNPLEKLLMFAPKGD